jgi:hypothetical protein
MMTTKILEAFPRDGYKVCLKFNDGITGEVDLSPLVGKGVFALWNDTENFKKFVVEDGRRLEWAGEIDLDADSLYMKLTGKKPEELFPSLKEDFANA